MISEVFKTYSNFINQGGPVVFILFLISIYLFILIAAKFKFLFFEIDIVKSQFKKDYQNITNDKYLSLNVSFFGTGNARALASGITKATLPTMTGMAISIVGLLTFTVLNSKSQSIISEI